MLLKQRNRFAWHGMTTKRSWLQDVQMALFYYLTEYMILSAKPERPVVHDAGIDLIIFNSDFSLLATSSWDKTIKFYNYHEFFELGNTIGGAEHIRNINYRARSLAFTSDNKLAAGLSDKSIRVWETTSAKLALMICDLLTRDMTHEEWNEMVGADIPYEKTRSRNP